MLSTGNIPWTVLAYLKFINLNNVLRYIGGVTKAKYRNSEIRYDHCWLIEQLITLH